ncbi:HD domain-containing protein [Marinobacter sp. 1-3A]|uniref:HD domain-containing protein n=1 Tax=Marinobacter sp. 1-3A TaxID=2582920 RepID=UPI0019033E34|nr:HD domain-containing protein [Marinobacter sp. 1-3A]MBK1872198.1 HD domain-containing protein [Marinobacter sp. 1-3A]
MEQRSLLQNTINETLEAPEQTLDYWRADIEHDAFYQPVLKSQAFQRLKGISFLGALDYAVGSKQAHTGSRAEHSLNVAALANFVATRRQYTPELKKHLIVAGLLHDIGHPPLSHSAEPFIKKHIGYGHHHAGEKILKGQHELGKALNKWLSENTDLSFLISLIDQNALDIDGGDLFSSPINIDTIEGITRSHQVFSRTAKGSLSRNRIDIAAASFLPEVRNPWEKLDQFWKMKHQVYAGLITSKRGLVADKLSQLYFQHESHSLSEQDIFTSEKYWKKRYATLFEGLQGINKQKLSVHWMSGAKVSYINRCYYLDESQRGRARYQCAKSAATTLLPDFSTSNHQLQFVIIK